MRGENSYLKVGFFVLRLLIAILFSTLIIKLAFIQIVYGEEYKKSPSKPDHRTFLIYK